MDDTARNLRERVLSRRSALEQTWSDTQNQPWTTDEFKNVTDYTMELQELGEQSVGSSVMTSEVVPFDHAQSPMQFDVSESQEADEVMKSLTARRTQTKAELQTTIKSAVHRPVRLPPIVREKSPGSGHAQATSFVETAGNGDREVDMSNDDDGNRRELRSKALTESIRQRMRQKLQEGRLSIGEGVSEDATKPSRRHRLLRQRDIPTRFDEPLGPTVSDNTLDRVESDDQLQSGLSSSVLARSHWQQALNAVTSQTMVPGRAEDKSYDFFTQSLEAPFEDLFPQHTVVAREEARESSTAEAGDSHAQEELEEEPNELDTSALITQLHVVAL
ncbi:uncharacterized protein LOC134182844 [Corticium candelabrum]|uniref:uncharacterized protein LOC134182844 n=1 Tax=Corticium candelabrum TaxID=121492 RepID=UPI002E2680E2|nr:uncharacterized protein LOC134182844 [Corticium candelabrum]